MAENQLALGFQRCGKSSLMRLAFCVGSRVSSGERCGDANVEAVKAL